MIIVNSAHAQSVIGDAPSVLELIMRVLSFLLKISSVLAVLAIVVAGILYMVSNGDVARTDLAKRGLVASISGLTVILISLVIVTVIIRIIGV